MSRVTNIILSTGSGLDDDAMAVVNGWLKDNHQNPLVSCDDEKLPAGWYGGSKFLETDIYIGAFNYLPIEEFVKVVRSAPWGCPESVQIFICDQEDDRFRVVNVVEEASDETT